MTQIKQAAGPEIKKNEAFPWRGLALSYLLLPANAYWLVHAEAVGHGPFPTTISLFPNVLFTLFFVVLLNLAAAKGWKPLLSRIDLAVMWGILCMGSSLASLDQIQVLVPIAADPYYFCLLYTSPSPRDRG